MPRRFPPFAAIRAFEAAARHCSLRLASEELNLSISGVSHQIKSLEQFLGIPLFNRSNNRLELTPQAKTYMLELSEVLDKLSSATLKAEAALNTTSISIGIFPSLAVLWLIPRLSKFYENAPSIDVSVVTSTKPLSLRSGLLDVAIRYQDLASIPSNSSLLYKETFYPVCTRQYANKMGLFDEKSDYKNATVIRCETSPTEWDDWFQSLDGVDLKPFRVLKVDNRSLALQAAQSGLGVAMARTPYAQEALASGQLVRLPNAGLVTGKGYIQTLSDSAMCNPAVRKFTSWLTEQARNTPE